MARQTLPMSERDGIQLNKLGITRDEYDSRQVAESTVKELIFDCEIPELIKTNSYAFEMWQSVIAAYKSWRYSHISNLDVTLLVTYCMTYQAYVEMVNYKKTMLESFIETGQPAIKILQALQKSEKLIDSKVQLMYKLGKSLYLDPSTRTAFLHKCATGIAKEVNKAEMLRQQKEKNKLETLFGEVVE